jgi:4-hydroxybenzoyl-CoA reductase subunit beta
MLRLPPFDYLAPRTLAEAVAMLAERGPEAMIVAGGTDLYPNMKRRQFEPKALVGLRSVAALRRIEGSAEAGLMIGAGMTLTQVSQHPKVRNYATWAPSAATCAWIPAAITITRPITGESRSGFA